MYWEILPESRASEISSLLTISSLAKLRSTAPSLNWDRASELIMPRVASIAGTCRLMMSERLNNICRLSIFSTLLESLQAASTDSTGSYPTTFISIWSAISATMDPIAPSPSTPRVLPFSSRPLYCFLLLSTSLLSSALSLCSPREFTYSMPGIMPRHDSSRPTITSSFTAFALAPGVLNTTMPLSV